MSSVSRSSTRTSKGAWGGQSNSIHALINFKQTASTTRSSMMQSRSGISADSDDASIGSQSSVSRSSMGSSMSDFSNSSRISTSMYHPSEMSTGSQSYKGKSHGGAAAFYRQHMLDNIKDWSVPRMICYDLLEASWFSSFIFMIILANTIIIAVQTDLKIQINGGWYFTLIDNLFLAIYTFELVLKLYVWRSSFFKSGWNCFDFAIVCVSYGDFMWTQLVGSLTKFNPRVLRLLRILRVLRALRALRVLRTITFFNSLQVMVATLLRSAPAWANIGLLLMLTLYIFAIMGQTLYGGISSRFSSLTESMFTMFQLITLDNWSQINDDVKNKPGGQTMILFLITYIIIQTLIFVNLFVAVIVNNLEEVQKRSYERIKQELAKKDRRNRHRSHTESAADLSRVALGYDDKVDVGGGAPGNMGNMDKYLNASSANQRKKQSMAYSLMLLAAVENNLESFHQQQRTLDDLVDIAN